MDQRQQEQVNEADSMFSNYRGNLGVVQRRANQ